jgi:hypothetical protein
MKEQTAKLTYVVLTAARNEKELISKTLKSMAAQTVKPLKWVVVSDGSTDGTDELVKSYAQENPLIELVRMPDRKERQFAAKAHCINTAYDHVKNLSFGIVTNLDADVSFGPTYFEFLLEKFAGMPGLGVAGTPYAENPEKPNEHSCASPRADLNHVSGPCQLFRRRCWEDVGGYVPVKGGAIDWIAVTTARMKGWQTRCFLDQHYFHHRKMGTAGATPIGVRFHYGKKAHYVGGHPLWEMLKGVATMKERPLIFGGISYICGYVYSAVSRTQRPVSNQLVRFHRAEQIARLKRIMGLDRSVI